MTGDVSYRPPCPGGPSLGELIRRRDVLIDSALAAETGDQESTEVYEVGLRGESKLVRKEIRNRINRSAAVMYWREVRATEAQIEEIASNVLPREAVQVAVVYSGPDDPPGSDALPPAPDGKRTCT